MTNPTGITLIRNMAGKIELASVSNAYKVGVNIREYQPTLSQSFFSFGRTIVFRDECGRYIALGLTPRDYQILVESYTSWQISQAALRTADLLLQAVLMLPDAKQQEVQELEKALEKCGETARVSLGYLVGKGEITPHDAKTFLKKLVRYDGPLFTAPGVKAFNQLRAALITDSMKKNAAKDVERHLGRCGEKSWIVLSNLLRLGEITADDVRAFVRRRVRHEGPLTAEDVRALIKREADFFELEGLGVKPSEEDGSYPLQRRLLTDDVPAFFEEELQKKLPVVKVDKTVIDKSHKMALVIDFTVGLEKFKADALRVDIIKVAAKGKETTWRHFGTPEKIGEVAQLCWDKLTTDDCNTKRAADIAMHLMSRITIDAVLSYIVAKIGKLYQGTRADLEQTHVCFILAPSLRNDRGATTASVIELRVQAWLDKLLDLTSETYRPVMPPELHEFSLTMQITPEGKYNFHDLIYTVTSLGG